MNPQQPDYSFITNPEQQPKKSLLPGGSKKQRLIIAGIGGTVLLLIFLVVFSLLFNNDSGKQLSVRLAQQHTELIRVSEIGQDKARGQAAKNLAVTSLLTLRSSEAGILEIANSSQDVNDTLLEQGMDSDTDETLTEAEQRSQFDEVFTELLSEELQDYRTDLQEAYDASSKRSNKELYQTLYTQLGDIIETASGAQR